MAENYDFTSKFYQFPKQDLSILQAKQVSQASFNSNKIQFHKEVLSFHTNNFYRFELIPKLNYFFI